MKRNEFIEQFTTTFLATWCVNNYDDACRRSDHKRLEHPPVEDAEYLANCAWDEIKKVGVRFNEV